ncbi:hypothetical protein D083_4318 [Dickeya solani RNS 08.23.3.1.A]|nr:hypothetical protein D083_4318 [Dickeya solani RNS 08.23.3.1.A]
MRGLFAARTRSLRMFRALNARNILREIENAVTLSAPISG